jgi:O-antigen/teichoic acid export membrane protein
MNLSIMDLKKRISATFAGLSKSSFKNSSILILSSVISQVINFLCYPFITHAINPAEFGKFALLLSSASIFTVFAFGRLELLFPKYKTAQERFDLLMSCLGFFFAVLLLLFLFLFFSNLLFEFARMDYIQHWSLMVVITFATLSLVGLINNYQVGIGSFKLLSILRLVQPLVTISSTLLMLKFVDGYWALFYGVNIANFFCILIGGLDLAFKKEFSGKIHPYRMWEIIKDNKKMVIINSPHALIDSVQTNLLNIVIGRYYHVDAVGNYSLANRLVRAPMTTVGGAISQVFYKEIHDFDHERSEDLVKYVRKVLFILLVLSFLVIGSLVIFLKLFFVKIFGANWKEVVPIIFALVPWVVANFVSSPLSQITIYKNRQGGAIIFGALYNGLTLLSLFLFGIFKYTLIENIFWTSCLGGLLNVVFILWILRILRDE